MQLLMTIEWSKSASRFAALSLLWFCTFAPAAQELPAASAKLPRHLFKNGEETLSAFAPISKPARYSVVKLDVDGKTAALAAVIDATGIAVTKSSEIKDGKITAWLANGNEAKAKLLARDDENDLALVKIEAKGLKPIHWASEQTFVGQWVITPGPSELPQAVGIVSVPPRKILHPRALIGVQLDPQGSGAKIAQVMPGLSAEKAGLKSGDLILTVNDEPLKEGELLSSRLRQFREGQSVKLRVKRGSEEFDATLEMKIPKPDRTDRWADRSDRMNRMGTLVSERAEGFELAIQHDSSIKAWQCGGPLLNLKGKAIGLNIARPGRVATYALPADLVKQSIRKMQAQNGKPTKI
jgi:serine protease Do